MALAGRGASFSYEQASWFMQPKKQQDNDGCDTDKAINL